MQDQSSVIETSPATIQKKTIPFALKEFGNVPPKSVSAWVAVHEKNLGKIAMEGIKVTDSERESDNKLEQVFDEEAEKAGVKIRRRQCVYATPLPPEKNQYNFTGNGGVVLEIKIDPNSDDILVADAERYSLAHYRLNAEFDNDENSAREAAETYWKDAVPLKRYIEEQIKVDEENKRNEYDYETTFPPNAFDFTTPEILIPQGIPAKSCKVHSIT